MQHELTPTSYIVLGLVSLSGEATPYALKQAVEISVGHFWSLPHSQLYDESARLADAGYLSERREQGGRRRRHYSLTDTGERALAEWRRTPSSDLPELRDISLLKMFFGANPRELAAAQLEAHREKLARYRTLHESDPEQQAEGARLAVEAGIAHEEVSVRFWSALLGRDSDPDGD